MVLVVRYYCSLQELIVHSCALADETRLTVGHDSLNAAGDTDMPPRSNELPTTGFALEIDGRIKTEFNTREGAENGAIELKRLFPALRIRLYDAETQSRHDVQA